MVFSVLFNSQRLNLDNDRVEDGVHDELPFEQLLLNFVDKPWTNDLEEPAVLLLNLLAVLGFLQVHVH